MLAILKQSLRRNYKPPLFIGLGLGLVSFLFTGLFNDFKDQLGQFVTMLPEGMEAIIGDMALGSTPEGWLSIELFPVFVPLGISIVAIFLGSNLIGREEDSGTLELLLASNQSRFSIAIQKLLSLFMLLALPAVILFTSIAVGSAIFNFQPNMGHVLAACTSAWALGATYGVVSFAAQALTGQRGLAVGIGAAVLGLTYVLTIISRMLEDWKPYEVISPMHYYNIPGTLTDGMDWIRFAVLVWTVLIISAVALVGFRRRDTGV